MYRRNFVPLSVCCPFALIAFTATCWLAGIRLNLTTSMPVGIYVTSGGMPTRGSMVLVCLPLAVAELARERGYLPQGGSCPGGVVPIGKTIVAIAGDTVVVTDTGLIVNGERVPNSTPLRADRAGRLLPRLRLGTYPVAVGQLWLLAGYSRLSFDSRYFGAVDVDQVHGLIRSVWIREGHE
jgi:conjugative transfer signal peptidase TraF